MERRTQERLRELANGDWEIMDPLIRRSLIILANEIDDIFENQRAIRRELGDTRKTVIAMMSAIIVAVVGTGLVNVIWR